MRVGGLVGTSRGTINSVYCGGSIVSRLTQLGSNQTQYVNIWSGGIIGGITGSIVVYFIMKGSLNYSFDIPAVVYFAAIGLIASLLTEFGDLVESVIKRKLGIKDMGKILPGHGGMLDRIDSIVFACPFICLAGLIL